MTGPVRIPGRSHVLLAQRLPGGEEPRSGGLFGNAITGVPYFLCAVNSGTAAFANWIPAPAGLVRSIAVSGSTVYGGGSFYMVSQQPQSYLVAVEDPSVVGVEDRPLRPTPSVEIHVAPNPLSGQTRIRFRLPKACDVTLRVFDLEGREARRILDRRWLPAGAHGVDLGAAKLGSGVYFCDLEAGSLHGRGRLVVIR